MDCESKGAEHENESANVQRVEKTLMREKMTRYFAGALGVVMNMCTMTYADTGSSIPSNWGPYLKFSGGGIQATGDGIPSGKQKESGPTGLLAVGTGYCFCNGLYLGGEVFAAGNKLFIKSTLSTEEGVDLHVTRKANPSFGGALQVGYVLNRESLTQDSLPSLIYVRMGVEKMSWARHAYATESSLGLHEEIKQDTVKPLFFVPGIGWCHHVTAHWAVSMEYQHALGTGVKKLTRNDKPKWAFQRLMWSISYHF